MSNSVTLIKLGGSIITNKDIPMSLRQDVLSRLVGEIAQARKEQPNMLFVVGHGQGSFGHVPAVRYDTMHGFVNKESRMGMAITQDIAAQLNRLVVAEFLKHDIPAVSLTPSNSLVTAARKPLHFFTEVFELYLKQGLFPITGGDVLVDAKQGCTIWSTEEVLAFFARVFAQKGWKVKKIVHVVEVDGVYDLQKKVVPTLTAKKWVTLKKAVTQTKGFDVTGGMALKVEESLALLPLGITSAIISGLKPNNVYNALSNKKFVGTSIE